LTLKLITLIGDHLRFWKCTKDKDGKVKAKGLAGRSSFMVRGCRVSKRKVSWLKELMKANNVMHKLEHNIDLWFFCDENLVLFSIIVWLIQNELLRTDLMKRFDPSDRKTKSGLKSIMKTQKLLEG
jgi:hypothetical protein